VRLLWRSSLWRSALQQRSSLFLRSMPRSLVQTCRMRQQALMRPSSWRAALATAAAVAPWTMTGLGAGTKAMPPLRAYKLAGLRTRKACP
jgi:hypothetical protein